MTGICFQLSVAFRHCLNLHQQILGQSILFLTTKDTKITQLPFLLHLRKQVSHVIKSSLLAQGKQTVRRRILSALSALSGFKKVTQK